MYIIYICIYIYLFKIIYMYTLSKYKHINFICAYIDYIQCILKLYTMNEDAIMHSNEHRAWYSVDNIYIYTYYTEIQ